jgi:long-chain acyl-CoA synthetase
MKVRHNCRTLIELFNRPAAGAELSDKICLETLRTDREEKITFGQLRQKAREFAVYLIGSKNIRKADKVAILGKNRCDWDVAFWGVILAGAVPVLIDPERPVEGVKKHLLCTDTRLLIMADDYQDSRCRENLKQFLCGQRLDVIEMTVYDKPMLDDGQVAEMLAKIGAEVKADDTAVIMCTSGTTGEPREVELTHTNLIANIQGVLDVVKITGTDKLGHIIPPCHSFGLTIAKLMPFWVGATNLYTNRYRHLSELIRDEGVTIFVGVPAVFSSFARKIEEKIAEQKEKSLLVRLSERYFPHLTGKKIAGKMGWGRLRFFVSGAAALPRWVLEAFWKRGLQLRDGYGTTESSPVYGFNASRRKLGSVGRPISTLLVKIVNDRNEVLRAFEKGEIVLGGACIMKGYYKNSAATDAVIKTDADGVRWLYTGDLGYLDGDGYLFITGRKKYLIVLPGGKNVSPEMVEQVLSRARYVEELVIVPAYTKGPDNTEEQAVKAIVRPAWDRIQADTGLCRSDLERQPEVLKNLLWQSINKCQQASEELAGFEKIRSKNLVEIRIDEFEKTATGKIKRNGYIEATVQDTKF